MKLHSINTGFFCADGGAMFGLLPKVVWQKSYHCDHLNRCRLAMRCFVVETDNRIILIDTGMGSKQLKETASYHPQQLTDLRCELNKRQIKPEQITDIVLSHLHFDHCGDATCYSATGEIVPTFPRARYHVSAAQWALVSNHSPLEAGSYFPENTAALQAHNVLHLVENDCEISEHVCLKLSDGHTPGQLVCHITPESGPEYIFAGDVIPTSLHLTPHCLSAFDLNALRAFETKFALLQHAAAQGSVLLFCHDAYLDGATIRRAGKTIKVKEAMRFDTY